MDIDQQRAMRARRRAFIRAHHPDLGGDAATFVAGLDAVTGGYADGSLTFVPRLPLRRRLVAAIGRRLRPPAPRVR